MNWLKRARREISGLGNPATAETAERGSTTTTSWKARASIGSNGSSRFQGSELLQGLQDDYEERAAILEFDGGLSREHAEAAAWALIYKNRRLH
jgi:hypothetical protein